MHRFDQRVTRLEDGAPNGKPLYVFWWRGRQTQEQALAKQFPDGVPTGRDLIFVTWGKDNAESPQPH
jgi:hypothetical protein